MVGQKATMGFYPSTGAQICSLSSLLIFCITTRPPVNKRAQQMMTIKKKMLKKTNLERKILQILIQVQVMKIMNVNNSMYKHVHLTSVVTLVENTTL